MRLDGAIFDLDGTLLDSMFIWDTIGEDYLRSLGLEPRDGLREAFKTMSLYQAACFYQREYQVPGTTEEIMAGVNGMIEHFYRDEVQVKPGVPHFLEALRCRDVRLCIATATDLHLVEAALKRTGIRPYFGAVFTCTSVGHGKDEPHIFHTALDILGTSQRYTLVLEDALYAIRTAKAAGYTVAGVFDPSEPDQAAVKNCCDYYIDDYRKAKGILL